MSGSSTVRCTAMRPSFLTKSCWRWMRSMSARGAGGSATRPSIRYSRSRERTYASAWDHRSRVVATGGPNVAQSGDLIARRYGKYTGTLPTAFTMVLEGLKFTSR